VVISLVIRPMRTPLARCSTVVGPTSIRHLAFVEVCCQGVGFRERSRAIPPPCYRASLFVYYVRSHPSQYGSRNATRECKRQKDHCGSHFGSVCRAGTRCDPACRFNFPGPRGKHVERTPKSQYAWCQQSTKRRAATNNFTEKQWTWWTTWSTGRNRNLDRSHRGP